MDRLTIFNRWRTRSELALPASDADISADDWLYYAALAFAAGQTAQALAAAECAMHIAPHRQLPAASWTFLHRLSGPAGAAVYADGRAFTAFIRGGGNVELYTQLSRALGAVARDYPSLTLLDIGVGDGLALLPALDVAPVRLDLVEPSAALLAQTTAALTARGIAARAHQMTLQQFSAQASDSWQLAQATFSLQSIPFAERPSLLAWLKQHADRVLIAEFDAPDMHDPLHPEYFGYLSARYERGLSEYMHDGGLVAQGFLMPVFWGTFTATQRTNFEQPIANWKSDLVTAGFAHIDVRPLMDYWWAPAVLLDARSSLRDTP